MELKEDLLRHRVDTPIQVPTWPEPNFQIDYKETIQGRVISCLKPFKGRCMTTRSLSDLILNILENRPYRELLVSPYPDFLRYEANELIREFNDKNIIKITNTAVDDDRLCIINGID